MTAGAALITGAGRRLGRALALKFAAEGRDIGIHYRSSKDAAAGVAKEVEALGRRAALIQADLGDHETVNSVVAQFFTAFPGGNLLINSASIYDRDTIETLDPEGWRRNMEINALGPILLARAFKLRLTAPGVVINMLDQKVHRITPDYFSYTLSKIALHGATRMLAMAFAPECRVNGIAPGLTLRSGDQTDEEFAKVHDKTPLGVGPTAEEICAAAQLIATSPAMTGQVITIDGGRHLEIEDPHGDLPKE